MLGSTPARNYGLLVHGDATDWAREPGQGSYARPERERRFLTTGAVPEGDAARLIEDRYLEGLRLRLRRVSGGGRCVHKLTQKVRMNDRDPSEVLITNMYLTEPEYAVLLALPGRPVVKMRSVVTAEANQFVVDEFQGRLQGLRMAEVEVRDLADRLRLPGWLGREVTHDDRFSGGQLAVADEAALQEMLRVS
jgi:CYTH domain-containing protein